MATRQGRCTNFGNCQIADKRQAIPIPQGADFVCPECGRALTETGVPVAGKTNPWIFIVIALLLLILGLFGWQKFGNNSSKTGPPVAGEEQNTILRLSGSNTIGANLAPAMAEAFLRSLGAGDVRTVQGANAEEKSIQGTLPGTNSLSVIKVAAHGSATAFTALAENGCDIGMASRQIKRDEATKLSALGDMFSSANEHVLGLDGVAVIVNTANPVRSLTKDQLQAIFSGETSDWSQVSDYKGAIKIYARDDKSGTFDTFKTLVLAGKVLASGAQRFEDSNALSDAVAADPDGIGFIGLPYVRSARAIAVSEKGARALQPTALTVATEDYPLSRRLYLYTPSNPDNKFTRKFVDFAISKRGQDVVGAAGFVAQNPTANAQPVAEGAPLEYKKLTEGAQRLSLNFRFRTGKSDLDNKALVDIDRVVSFIADLKYTGQNVLLFGFADSTGTREGNNALSLTRGKAIEEQFAQRGLQPAVVRGFGSELPVASNETDEGREKNRRVEIWIKK